MEFSVEDYIKKQMDAVDKAFRDMIGSSDSVADEDEPPDVPKRVTSIPEGFKIFECENGKKYCGRENACWFCEHLDDVIFDYTHGPYLLHCGIDKDPEIGTSGECDSFEYIKRDWEVEV